MTYHVFMIQEPNGAVRLDTMDRFKWRAWARTGCWNLFSFRPRQCDIKKKEKEGYRCVPITLEEIAE